MARVVMTYEQECLKCTTCKEYLPVTLFSPNPDKARGYQYTCNPCRKDARKEKDHLNGPDSKHYRKFKHLSVKYGLSKEGYMEMLKEQAHRCRICGLDEVDMLDTKLHVDHNHSTGLIRGLLCRACNHGVGNFKDSPELLAKAIDYLEKYDG